VSLNEAAFLVDFRHMRAYAAQVFVAVFHGRRGKKRREVWGRKACMVGGFIVRSLRVGDIEVRGLSSDVLARMYLARNCKAGAHQASTSLALPASWLQT
jgi:hypothetical protein